MPRKLWNRLKAWWKKVMKPRDADPDFPDHWW